MSDPNGWVSLGPVCVPDGHLGRERYGRGPVSGRCTAIALDPVQPDQTIYVGTAIGGVWKSTDGGLNWTPKSDFEACLSIGCITVDPSNRQRIYVGTGEANEGGGIIPGQGLLVSENGGDTWALLGHADFVGKHIGHIVVDRVGPDTHLYAATTFGLYHSPDSGTTWSRINIPGTVNTWITGLHLDTSGPDKRLYVAVLGHGIFRRDGTGAFAPLANNAPAAAADVYRIALAVATDDPQIVYAAFGRGSTNNKDLLGVWRSSNRGDRWEQVAALPLPAGAKTGQTGYNLHINVDPTNHDRVFLGELRLWRTNDGGVTWSVVSDTHGDSIGLHADQHAVTFNPLQPDKVWAGNDGGVFYSADGGSTWKHRNRGLSTFQYYALALHPERENLALVGSQDNGIQRYHGHPAWQIVRGGDGFYCAIDPVAPTAWYGSYTFSSPITAGDSDAVFRSSQAGAEDSFENISDNAWLSDYAGGVPANQPPYLPFVHSPTEAGVLYVGTTKLYRRQTAPDGWEAATLRDTGLPFSTGRTAGSELRSETITAIAVSRSNPSFVYVGTADGRFFQLERGGDELWTAVERTTGLPSPLNFYDLISDIAVHPTDPESVYVSIGYEHNRWQPLRRLADGRIFFSADGGQNWLPRGSAQLNVSVGGITIDHGDNPVNAIIIDPANPAHVLIGCDVGIFRSTDEGANWVPWHQNLPHTSISDLQIHEPTRSVRVATRGRGVWERRLDAPAPAPPVDLYLRDNSIDTGRRATPDDLIDPLPPFRHVVWTSSADIKVDANNKSPSSTVDYTPGGRIDFIGFEKMRHENPRENQDSKVYVQVHNRGPDEATNVRVRVFYSEKGDDGFYPDLPADFWTVFPAGNSATANLWSPIGPAATIAKLRPAEPGVVSFDWAVPSNSNSTVALLAVVSNAQDPVNEAHSNVAVVARTNKHVALRELSVSFSPADMFAKVLVAIAVGGIVAAGVISELD